VLVIEIVVLAVVLGSWQLCAETGALNPIFISDPSSIASAFYTSIASGSLFSPLGTTLYETLVGFGIGVAIGNVLALLLHEIPILERALQPFLTALNNLPRFALAPLFVLWFGLGSMSRILLVVSLVFFIGFVNTYAGLQNASRDHLLLGATLGVRRFELFRLFILPSALPSIFAGLQLGLTYSFLTAVVAEMLSGGSGIGAQLVTTAASYEMASFFAFLVALVIVATGLSVIMRGLESQLLRWRKVELEGLS
jgi:NitT/TauT family transport system permease protein